MNGEPSTPEFELVWADEFENDGRPDANNWSYERGFIRNREAQWYQPENAWCENGLLIIEGRRERVENPRYRRDSRSWREKRQFAEYTSASLNTRGKQQWQYGRFEIRARIRTEPGLWPAIWTLGVEGRWPHNGEIDIMEFYRDMILANVAWGGSQPYRPIWDDTRTPMSEFTDPNWSEKFHIWRMDWDKSSIKLYLDDRLLNQTDLSDTVNQDAEGKNPFHQPHYLLLNLAVGGTQGGDPTYTAFPTRYEIDYVRVYQKKEPEKPQD